MGWLVGDPWVALIIAWGLTPLGLYAVAYVFESRIPGRDFRLFKDAFRGFMPGDVFLGLAFMMFVTAIHRSDVVKDAWFNSALWHGIVFIGAVVLGLAARKFLDAPNYTKRQMRSPSKVYHDFVLYIGYGYVFTTTAVAALGLEGWSVSTALGLLFVGFWVLCLALDLTTSKQIVERLARKSHPVRWRPIWR